MNINLPIVNSTCRKIDAFRYGWSDYCCVVGHSSRQINFHVANTQNIHFLRTNKYVLHSRINPLIDKQAVLGFTTTGTYLLVGLYGRGADGSHEMCL